MSLICRFAPRGAEVERLSNRRWYHRSARSTKSTYIATMKHSQPHTDWLPRSSPIQPCLDRRREIRIECISGYLKGVGTVRKPADSIGADQCLESVSGGDDQRGRERAIGCDIDQKGAVENRRPNPRSKEQTARQRDAGRGRDGTALGLTVAK